ncbi:methylase involved in ubiquinone/menaquinone biosynthesis [Desulfosporosinus acidiphilus SJ4]|uniref:Methylase involved in ubiquinone/menaquinone biosynthesis n=1 Tax=Desulfosporosinus acidiphilus (strain DSM 22704 / JCM 16185 / SJ4) TaxID=646529 RepID=I4D325_DESAJ|nr:methylase involved in ubiquinone/menaquinone biosynthesis [Desulfosporosinus acidiphilus SJ4]
MDVSMLALLAKTTTIMEYLGFLWVTQTGLELNLWAELEKASSLEEIMTLHPDWDEILLDHWLEQAHYLELLTRKNDRFQTTKLAKAVNKYRNFGLEALYKELTQHWTRGFAELPGLMMKQREKLTLETDMQEELISKASLASEPFVWPFLRTKCQKERWKNVLDLGCGEGRYLKNLSEEFGDLRGVGLEMNPAVAGRGQEMAKASEGRIQILCKDIFSLVHQRKESLSELGTFDLCLLNNSIYYFTQEQRIELLQSIKEFLKPGGQVGILTAVRKGEPVRVFHTHLPQNLMSFFLACHQGFSGLPTAGEITSLLERSGYSDVDISVMPLGTSHYFFAKRTDEPIETSR